MLEGKNFAFIATLSPEGSPRVTPVWVDTDGEHVLINTAIGRLKQKNVKRDPRVAVALTESANPYNFITLEGRVVEQVSGQIADDHIDKMAKRYLGVDKYPHRQPGERRVILKIKPEHVFLPQSR
jgi:PPOX class probable F420-dependent enzyme